jgi:hypothetical protein
MLPKPISGFRAAPKGERNWEPKILTYFWVLGLALNRIPRLNPKSLSEVIGAIILSIILSFPATIIGWLLISGMIYLGVKILRGNPNLGETKLIFAFSMVPINIITYLIYYPVSFLAFGFFRTFTINYQGGSINNILALLAVISAVWTFTLLIRGVGMQNQFPVWKAVGAIFFCPVVITIVVSGVALFVGEEFLQYFFWL